MATKPWPRLSETLPPCAGRKECRRCHATDKVQFWQEHGDDDQPQPIVIALCEACADQVIERHPRLYRALEVNEPFPGTMDLCENCLERSGTACSSPQASFNGGPGLHVIHAKPQPYHLSYADKRGRRCGGFFKHWPAPAVSCDGQRIGSNDQTPAAINEQQPGTQLEMFTE